MKIIKIVVFVLGLLVLVAGVGLYLLFSHVETLTFEEVYRYKLDLNLTSGIPEKISGAPFKEFFFVKDVNAKRSGKSLTVLVEVNMLDNHHTEDFIYPLEIPADVDELRFGLDEHLLWTRKDGQIEKNQPRN